MRICLINSSYEGVKSPFEKIEKDSGVEVFKQIDLVITETDGRVLSWGIESDDVAGVEATRYLESKGVPILTNPSHFLAKTKIDLQKAAERTGLRMPHNMPGRYPKIVKYSDGCGSLRLDHESICHSDEAVQQRFEYPRKDNISGFGVLVQDYIVGKECSALVVEMGSAVVALTPLQYVFPRDTPPEQEFLTWHNKFEACEDGTIQYAFVEEQPAKANLQKAAEDAFKALEVTGGGAWARVDMRLDQDTGDVYVIEVNCLPVVFYPVGNSLGDDLVVAETFPGGQAAFFDMLLATKLMQLGQYLGRATCVGDVYNNFADDYDALWAASSFRRMEADFAAKYDFSGTVLDVACGRGAFGFILHEQNCDAEISGIELAEGMLKAPWIQSYKQPIRIGPMQELIMDSIEFDHIVCFGALNFLDPVEFNAVLARMFMLARRSVTFEVDDLSDEYIEVAKRNAGELFANANHVKLLEDFGIPKGWRLVNRERQHMYTSPRVVGDVEGIAMRFERVLVSNDV